MMPKNAQTNVQQRTTNLGNLGTIQTIIRDFEDGTSELEQSFIFLGQNGTVHEVTSGTGGQLLGSPADLKELESLVLWIKEKSIRDA